MTCAALEVSSTHSACSPSSYHQPLHPFRFLNQSPAYKHANSILPLMLVYFAEYLINQSVAPTLLFPLNKTPFTEYRSFYPTYAVRLAP